jgi:type IV secretion system protein VirB9
MTRVLVAAALLALSAPAIADDPRLVERPYNPDEVVRIEGRTNVQATIRFGAGEQIENVAIGDSTAWQVTPNRRANQLFIKPLADRATTNMTVVTDKHTYLFDLVANPANRNALYVLAFTYPDEPVADAGLAEAGGAAGPTAVELTAANDPYAVVDPAALNFAWEAKGARALLPAQVYDDGAATFLSWPAGTPLPAILVKDQAGGEGPVNFAVRGETIVVDGVPGELVLRSGEDRATLTNRGPARVALTPARPPALAQASAAPVDTEVK